MKWPWSKPAPERRQSGGDFNDAVVRLIEAQVAGTAADASSTAAVEAASGALSRAFASADVQGPPWVRDAVTPGVLAQMGRDLVRAGDSMHVIRVGAMGEVRLIPAASWHFQGSHDSDSWSVRVTVYGPSDSTTWHLPASSVVFVKWGSTSGQPYVGTGPLRWAHTTARLHSEAERSLADESAGPVAQLLPLPEQGKPETPDDDPLAALRADLLAARGKVLTPETTAGGYGDGRGAAPMRDFDPRRLGPNMGQAFVELADAAFARTLTACGTPPSLFVSDDGTAQREAVRRWHLNVVLPLARLAEHELTRKLETEVRLRFDTYPMDMVSRASVVHKLTAAGVALPVALAAVGIDE